MEQKFSVSKNNYFYFYSLQDRFLTTIQYILFKTIGLSPWALDLAQIVKNHRNQSSSLITTSIYGSLYNIVLILLLTTYNIVVFVHQYPLQEIHSRITTAVGISLRIIGVMTAIFVWLSYILRQRIMVQIVRKLINVDRIMAKCCYKTNPLTDDNYIHLTVLSNFIACSVGLVFAIKAYSISIIPVRMVPGLINSWVMIQFSLLLNMITNRLKSINSRILRLGNVDIDIKPRTLLADKLPLGDSKLVAFDIVNIKIAHSQLCELCSEVSDFYGFPILIATIYSGMSSIFYSYFVILSFFKKYIHENVINQLSVAFWFSYMIMSFIFMTVNVSRIILQSKQTADAIHLILDRCTMDLKIQHQLTEFSRDLLHQKIEFSACGIISLDNSLLFAVSGTIVTYLIILIQFRLNNQQT